MDIVQFCVGHCGQLLRTVGCVQNQTRRVDRQVTGFSPLRQSEQTDLVRLCPTVVLASLVSRTIDKDRTNTTIALFGLSPSRLGMLLIQGRTSLQHCSKLGAPFRVKVWHRHENTIASPHVARVGAALDST
jgi:hypothetical protein